MMAIAQEIEKVRERVESARDRLRNPAFREWLNDPACKFLNEVLTLDIAPALETLEYMRSVS